MLNLTLELGTITETVTVEAETTLVNTVSGSLGHVVQEKQITSLPLNSRAVFDLVNLTPGSFVITGGDQRTDVLIGGGRPNSAMVYLDGIIDLRGGIGSTIIEISPPVESMREFKVQANNMGAEYGRSAAGMIRATTKSGTNELHGSLYEFIRNDKIDSAGWGVDKKAKLRRNQFGVSIGAPIVKNKTFIFYNFEGIRERRGRVRTRRVTTALEAAGDFSQTQFSKKGTAKLLPIFDPLSGEQFPNNAIPLNRQDPVAQNVLSFLPPPNRTPDNPITLAGNYQENAVDLSTRDKHVFRLDHSFSDNTRAFWRYTLAEPDDIPRLPTAGFGVADPDARLRRRRFQNMALNFQHVFSPTLVGTLTAGYARTSLNRTGISSGQNFPEKLGLSGVPPDVFPRFEFRKGLVPMTSIAHGGEIARRAGFTNGQVEGNMTWTKGSHNLKFGSQYFRFHGNDVNRRRPSGRWRFEPNFTKGKGVKDSGLPLADFFLGQPDSVDFELGSGTSKRSYYISGYLQDDWKLTPSLTINLGFRYETESPLSEVYDRLNSFDPSVPHPLAGQNGIPEGTLGVVTFTGRNGKGSRLEQWDKNNFSPRFGFAWSPFGGQSTVVRGGYGIFFGNPFDGNLVKIGHKAFDASRSFVDPVPFTMRDGVPAGFLVTPAEESLTPDFGAIGTAFPQSSIDYIDPTRRTPYTQNMNVTIEHQFKNIVFELGYVGNLGRKLIFRSININHIPTELLARKDIKERLRRPFPQFPGNRARVLQRVPNWGISNYHALLFRSERRFSNGLGWIISYAWSKKIDNLQSSGPTIGDDDDIQNLFDRKNERSASTNDIRHRLVMSPIVELPFGKGKRWLQNGLLSHLAGGWSLGTITTLQTGAGFGVTVRNGTSILGDKAADRVLRPNLVSNPELSSSRKGAPAEGGVRGIQWFDPGAFVVPDKFTLGNASRTLPGLASPRLINFDFSIMKNMVIHEQTTLQFRFELFNAFNTPHFGVPGSSLGGGGFGIASATGSDRELQFALKLLF
ncbi:MAG: hypothetical protein O6850_06615 [Acidobacteria bacterium]|nr:hypothetical protein [Acidobacteriota bacterium]